MLPGGGCFLLPARQRWLKAESRSVRYLAFRPGVLVSSNKDEPSMKAADALVRELSALGFDTRKASNTGNGAEPVVVVTVQARPEGAQGELKLNAARR